ncbi:MAG: nucleotidyl transferase AbiEii/AbiGii toxin family protein [Candidatus Magasanikbacteria bacterium]|nr:nucleotidyl transferase AbiEii/AbiGii toxin family protein [Candidatus Magasanikbacteria bacterium]
MAIKMILSKNQQKLLKIIGDNKNICQYFYLTGGTALAEFYLHHRLSEDLDFFSEEEIDPQIMFAFLKSIQKSAGIKKIDSQQSFNRNLFFLYLQDGDVIKTEFTYFPFPRIEKKNKMGNLFVDSMLDIAVNKVFTIYQKSRSRDFIDLYLILQAKKWTIANLVKKAKIKFDWHVDPLQLAGQFLHAEKVKDYPRMIKTLKPEVWSDFFEHEAKKLEKQIIT